MKPVYPAGSKLLCLESFRNLDAESPNEWFLTLPDINDFFIRPGYDVTIQESQSKESDAFILATDGRHPPDGRIV